MMIKVFMRVDQHKSNCCKLSKGDKEIIHSKGVFKVGFEPTSEAPNKIKRRKNNLSEVGFEPTPGEPDCDLNAAP